jgi:hypothetical protein
VHPLEKYNNTFAFRFTREQNEDQEVQNQVVSFLKAKADACSSHYETSIFDPFFTVV